MMPSPPIDDRSDTRPSGRPSAGGAPLCIRLVDSAAAQPSIGSHNVWPTHFYRRAKASFEVKRAHQRLRSNLSKQELAPKSP